MKIFVAGATGVLGRRLVRQLVAQGHEVIGLARSPRNEAMIQGLGGTPRSADLFNVESLVHAAEGCEIVVHAATSIPPATAKDAEWAINDRIRREGTAVLTSAAAQVGARGYLQQSILWVARPPDQKAFDEDSPLNAHGTYQSAADAEAISREAGAKHGYAVGILRGALFYSADSAHIIDLAERLRKRQLPVVGSGKNLFCLIHAEDAASAFVAAIENLKDGLWHLTDDEPVSQKELLTHFADVLGAPAPQGVPEMMARMFAGDAAVSFLTANTETTSRKFRADFGWKPAYPSYHEGLKQVVSEWNAIGK